MKMTIFFPGIGYHCDKPLLYYSRKMVQECGCENVVTVNYSYDGGNIRGNEKKMKEAFEVLYRQAEKSLEDINFDKYEDIVFVSKSIGTIIATAFAKRHRVKCRNILYTPLEQTFEFVNDDAIAFIGTSDPWSDIEKVQQLAEQKQIPIHIYENANHSLETKDTMKNIEILRDVMEATLEFYAL